MDKLETIVVQEETQDDSDDEDLSVEEQPPTWSSIEKHLMISRKIAVEILSNYYF